MGKGLMVKQSGVHVAFAAGTGVLVFIDLVMQLALVNMGLAHKVINDHTQVLDHERFLLVLYVSFPSRDEAVGLELFEALSKYCTAKGLKNFELVLRLSKEKLNPRRWDEKFVLE